MTTCTVCGQPMPNARANRLTCSASCRTRRYRLAQPRPLKGSGRLRQGLMLARPVWFVKLQPDQTDQELGNNIGVPLEQWDATLELLNQMMRLLEPIEVLYMWQGQTGYTPPNEEPIEDMYLADLGNVGEIVLQEVGDLRAKVGALKEVRSGASRVLTRQLGRLEGALGELVQQSRQFVRQVLAQTEPYEVDYGPALLASLAAMQTAVEEAWLAVHDQVE